MFLPQHSNYPSSASPEFLDADHQGFDGAFISDLDDIFGFMNPANARNGGWSQSLTGELPTGVGNAAFSESDDLFCRPETNSI